MRLLGTLFPSLGASVIIAALVLLACAPSASRQETSASQAPQASMTLEQLVKAANAEGQLSVTGPSNLGEQGAQNIVAAMNAKYGTNIRLNWTSAGDFGPLVSQIITEQATGGRPTWDAVVFNDTYMATLWLKGSLQKFPYKELFGVPDKALIFEGNTVGFANQLVLPAYNSKLVSEAEAPKTWDEVVDQKWAGKIGMHTAVHHLARLSQLWGDEKTTEYAKRLAALNPKLGRINETYKSLVLGETLLSFTQTNSQMDEGLKKGEPVAWAIRVRPAIAPTYQCGVLKGAQNPNAAALLCGFLFDKAAQEVWGENVGRQSIFDPSTPLGKIYAEGPQSVLVLDGTLSVEELDNRVTKYTQILGFR